MPSRRHTHTVPFFVAFLPTRFRSSGYSGTERQGRTPGGATRSREGIAPSPLHAELSCAPGYVFPGSRASSLPQPPVVSPRPQHRRAPHTSQRYVFPPCRGGDLHPLSHAQPSGFGPEDPFRVAQPTPGSPQVCGLRSSRGLCPQRAAFGAAPARISPSTRLTRQRGEVAGPPDPHVRPRRQPGSRSQAV